MWNSSYGRRKRTGYTGTYQTEDDEKVDVGDTERVRDEKSDVNWGYDTIRKGI